VDFVGDNTPLRQLRSFITTFEGLEIPQSRVPGLKKIDPGLQSPGLLPFTDYA